MMSCTNLLPDLSEFDWSKSILARAVSRAFTPPPDLPIWQWADANVLLQNEDAAEPGEYRSSKTPWTRRLQELMRHPLMWMFDYRQNKWLQIPVWEISVQKSSQSGYSEAAMNGIRWRATYRPCNVIYTIDSSDEAKKIARRLLRSFKFLDKTIFTGDPNDIKTLEFKLRGMELLFYGSFSEGKYANKQAPLRIADEVEEHGANNTLENLDSRGKTASEGGLQINLSKPKVKNGPINKAFQAGNQEEYFVPCPHCRLMQPLTFFPEEIDVKFSEEFEDIKDENTGEVLGRLPTPLPLGEKRKLRTGRIVFDHCKNLLGEWDQLRVLTDTYYECAGCHGRIDEDRKRWMIDRGVWTPMVLDGSPGVVTQHFNDLYSEDNSVRWGKLVIKWLKLKKQGIEGIKSFYNQFLGKPFSEEANTTESKDILDNMAGRSLWFVDSPNTDGQIVRHIFHDEAGAHRLEEGNRSRGLESPVLHSACPPFSRGTIPFEPFKTSSNAPPWLILGSDVGGNYARWVLLVAAQNMLDMAVIDWGIELDPDAVRLLAQNHLWPVRHTGEKCRIARGFVDARWRPRDVYMACLASRGLLVPTKGLGGATAKSVKLFSFVHVTTYHEKFFELHYNDQRAKDALYIDRIKKKRKRLWFPMDIEHDEQFMEELCAERQLQDRTGAWYWSDEPEGPNHYGDAVKEAVIGFDYMTRNLRTTHSEDAPI